MILRRQQIVIIAIVVALVISAYPIMPLAPLQTASAQEQVCYVFEASLTNNTGTNQTATIQFLSPSTFQPISPVASVTVIPGETVVLRLAAFIATADAPPVLGGGPGALTVNSLSFGPSANCAIDPRITNPGGDEDGDGILNQFDNCIFTPNPGQENGWGDPNLGDACDPNFYDNRAGVKAFQLLSDSSFVVYAACQDSQCYPIARFRGRDLAPGDKTFSEGVAEWYVTIYLLGSEGGQQIYQMNTYNAGLLQDDGMLILVNSAGIATWRYR